MNQTIKTRKILLLLLLGLYAFLYIIATTVADIYFLMTDPVAGITYKFREDIGHVVIEEVVPKSPADFAGMQPGDWLLIFNQRTIASEKDLLEAYREIAVGNSVPVTIMRQQQEFHLQFVAERRLNVYTKHFVLGLLPGVLFCYTLCLIGMFVLFNKLGDRTAHVFYLMVLFWALAMWGDFPFGSEALFKFLPHWLGWLRLIYWPLAVGLLLHFTLIFPFEKETYKRHPKLYKFVCYGSLLLILPFIYAESYGLKWGEPFLEYGQGFWFSLNFFLAMSMLGHSGATAPNPHIASQAKIMYRGTMLTLVLPTGLYFIPQIFFKPIPYSEYLLLLLVLWPMVLAYAIIRHRFMDINVIIKRGVAYALTSGFVVAAYFLFVVGIGKLALYLTGSSSQLITIIATLLIAAAFEPVRNRIRRFVDQKFYPARFVYREAVREFSHQLVKVVDLEKWFELLQQFLFETMKIQQVVVLWKTPREEYAVKIARGQGIDANVKFSNNDIVIASLQHRLRLLDLSALTHPNFSDDEQNRWQRLRSEIVFPLLSQGGLVGMLSLGEKENDEPYYKEDLELLETFGDQINISVDNALLTEKLREQERLKKELEVARRIQLSSLPQADPQVSGLEISGVSIPALEVGGDYYDYIQLADGRFGVVIGDVSGKGTSAALYMSQLKGILQTASKFHHSLTDLMTEVNTISFDTMEEQSFITLACGAFDLSSRKVRLVRAGHLPLIHYSAKDKSSRRIMPRGIGIGLEDGRIFKDELEEIEIAFGSGDVFLFYTDGIVDPGSPVDEEVEGNRLVEVLQANGWESASLLREKIIAQVQAVAGETAQKDDMTLVVVKIV
jgi:serine phosphatase RsbU (regulator of sigma subunit)